MNDVYAEIWVLRGYVWTLTMRTCNLYLADIKQWVLESNGHSVVRKEFRKGFDYGS